MGILWNTFEIFINFFENAVMCYFIQKHFQGRFSVRVNRLVNIGAVTVIAGVSTIYLYVPPPWLLEGLGFILFWLLYTLLFRRGYFYEKCFWSVFLACVVDICGVIAVTLAMFINGVSQDTIIFEQNMGRFILIVTAKSIQCFTFYYFSKLYITHQTMQKRIYTAKLSLLCFCFFMDTTLMNVGQVLEGDSHILFYVAGSTVCVLVFLMVVYYLYYKMAQQQEYLLKAQSELQFKALIEQHNEELIKGESNMRAWRHDIHNHLQSLISLARIGDNTDMEEYILQLGHQLGELEGVCNTGHNSLDAIVSAKHSIAQADGISVNLHIMPIARIPINDIDLTSLLGNLFDNAIEACCRVDIKKRSIDLFLGMMGNMICIKMTNATDGTERMEGNKFLTTKADTSLHGWGLNNIDRIAHAVNGLVEREHKDNVFTTSILFPMGK